MKDKVKKFWNQHGDVIVAVAYSVGLVVASSVITASLTKAHCDAGWWIKSGKFANMDETLVVLEHENGQIQHLILHHNK